MLLLVFEIVKTFISIINRLPLLDAYVYCVLKILRLVFTVGSVVLQVDAILK